MKKQEKSGRFPWTVSWFLTWFQKSPVRKFVTSSKGNETGWIIKRSKTQRFNSESIQILSTDNAIEYSIIYIYLLYIYTIYIQYITVYIQYIYNILQFNHKAVGVFLSFYIPAYISIYITLKRQEDVICSYLLHGYYVIRILNLCIEERSEAEFFCAVWEWEWRHNHVINMNRSQLLILEVF